MKTLKAFTRSLGILALLLITLSLTAAQVTGPVGQDVGPLTPGPIPIVDSPEGGGGAVPGGPGFVALNAFDFKPYSQSYNYYYGGTLLNNTGVTSAFFIAPVHLPQGATINQVVAYYKDEDAGMWKDIAVVLLQCNDFTEAAVYMAEIYSSGAITGITYAVATAITFPVVDNSRYSYIVQVNLPNSASVWLSAVRVDYTYSLSLPAVMK